MSDIEPGAPSIVDRSPARVWPRDGMAVALVGLMLRVAVVAWACQRIPPAADGTFYDTIARRIAHGQGYTWLWPDGTVTFAAHYPVGYPALVGFGYALFGAHPGVAMALGAVLGALSVFAIHQVVARHGSRRSALLAGILLAVHPGLLSYTPALMTEGITASLIALALYAFVRAREAHGVAKTFSALAMATVIGAATYVRPQSLVLAPLLGALLVGRPSALSLKREWLIPLVVTATTLLVIVPWTARNCEKMHRCALVSFNGGWNLLIGTDPEAHGSWAAVKVPDACREVFDEAEKDACFGGEAQKQILAHPFEWLALVPSKLGATFDYAGAGPWYLHAANPQAFPYKAKVLVGGIEVVFERLVLLAALVGVARRLSRGTRLDRGVALVTVVSAISLFTVHAYFAVLGLCVGLSALVARRLLDRDEREPVFGPALAIVGSTLIIHAVFFGAGRYSLVVFPVLVALASLCTGPTPDQVSASPVLGSFDRGAAGRAS